jgi:DNA segregation ATPase FtsK/SpoIIIE, S-DNA-T family
MFQDRNLKVDLAAMGLIALTLFLAVALTTYDPADPLTSIASPLDPLRSQDLPVFPPNDTIQNACGPWGALTADLLLNGVGWGAYHLLLSLTLLAAVLLQRQPIDAPVVRFLGWLMTLVGTVTLAAMLIPQWSPGPVIGSGGYLGALLEHALMQYFARLGGLILSLSVVVGGILLCTDYVLLRGLASVASSMARMARRLAAGGKGQSVGESVHGRSSSAVNVSGNSNEEEEQDESDSGIRIRRKHRGRASDVEEEFSELLGDDEADDAADASWEDEQEDDDGEQTEDDSVGEDPELEPDVAITRKVAGGKKVRADQEHDSSGPRIRKRGKKPSEAELPLDHLDEAARGGDTAEYELPSIDLLVPGGDICFESQEKEIRRKAKILEQTFADFGFQVKVVEIETGPVIAQYEVQLEAGLRLSKITGLADDLAIALRVPSVRIVAPIPGKNTVGIEVPNSERQVVRLREVLEESNSKTSKMRIPLFLGKDVSGNPLTVDLSTLPHLLIAGRTGTGKSVCLNAIISSMLMTKRPDEVRMLMIDPKMVELSGYARLPHLMHPVVTDMKKAEAILAWAVDKMEERYALLARAGVRHVSSYNQLSEEELMDRLQPETEEERQNIPLNLPFIVIVADEMADLMMTSGKEVEQHIIRLAQKSRAVGIHLILATQKPTVDVITGLIKSNLPARISFQVASRTDSRVVLDEMGAEKLLGNGDMLFLWPGTSTLLRGQGTYLGDDEIDRMVEFVSRGEQNFVNELVNIQVADDSATELGDLKKRDELYHQAVDVILREGRGSVSLLQRALGIGYGRAARLIDFMEEDSIVGPYAGSQAREILISFEDWERMRGAGSEAPAALPGPPPLPPRRSNRFRPDEQGWDDDEGQQQAEPEVESSSKSARRVSLKAKDGYDDQDVPDEETEETEAAEFEDGEYEEDEFVGGDEEEEEDELEEENGDYEDDDYEEDEDEYEEEYEGDELGREASGEGDEEYDEEYDDHYQREEVAEADVETELDAWDEEQVVEEEAVDDEEADLFADQEEDREELEEWSSERSERGGRQPARPKIRKRPTSSSPPSGRKSVKGEKPRGKRRRTG